MLIVEKYSNDERNYQGVVAVTPLSGYDDVVNQPNDYIYAPSERFQYGMAQDTKRIFVKFKAPDTGKILLVMRVYAYARNQTYADFYCARPMLEECTEHTREPSPWQNAGVTAIHGGSIVTKTITAQQIAAGAVTANEIAANTITGNKIASRTITANQIATKSITANEMSVGSLSAISANLGHVTAGTITGTSIKGNTIEGGVINGSTVSGGIIKGARLEGVTGVFTGSLKVSELVGGNLYEQVFVLVKFKGDRSRHTYRWYKNEDGKNRRETLIWGNVKAEVLIKPSAAKRLIVIGGIIDQKFTDKHNTMIGIITGDYIQKSGNSFILNPGKSVKITFNQWVRNEFDEHVDSVSTTVTSQVYSDTSLIEVIS